MEALDVSTLNIVGMELHTRGGCREYSIQLTGLSTLLFMPTLWILTQSPEPSYAVTSCPSGTLERCTTRGPGWLKSFANHGQPSIDVPALGKTNLSIWIIRMASTVAIWAVVKHAIHPLEWLITLMRDLNLVSSPYCEHFGLICMCHVVSTAALRFREVDIEGRPVPATVQEVCAASGYPLVVRISLVSCSVQQVQLENGSRCSCYRMY